MRTITYNVYGRDEKGNVKVAKKLAKMAAYHRRAFYPHKGDDKTSTTVGIYWANASGASEGVAVARYVA